MENIGFVITLSIFIFAAAAAIIAFYIYFRKRNKVAKNYSTRNLFVNFTLSFSDWKVEYNHIKDNFSNLHKEIDLDDYVEKYQCINTNSEVKLNKKIKKPELLNYKYFEFYYYNSTLKRYEYALTKFEKYNKKLNLIYGTIETIITKKDLSWILTIKRKTPELLFDIWRNVNSIYSKSKKGLQVYYIKFNTSDFNRRRNADIDKPFIDHLANIIEQKGFKVYKTVLNELFVLRENIDIGKDADKIKFEKESKLDLQKKVEQIYTQATSLNSKQMFTIENCYLKGNDQLNYELNLIIFNLKIFSKLEELKDLSEKAEQIYDSYKSISKALRSKGFFTASVNPIETTNKYYQILPSKDPKKVEEVFNYAPHLFTKISKLFFPQLIAFSKKKIPGVNKLVYSKEAKIYIDRVYPSIGQKYLGNLYINLIVSRPTQTSVVIEDLFEMKNKYIIEFQRPNDYFAANIYKLEVKDIIFSKSFENEKTTNYEFAYFYENLKTHLEDDDVNILTGT